MHTRKRGGALLATLAFALLLAGAGAASAQEEGGDAARRPQARPEINFEVQLQLLVTAEGAETALAKPPQTLDGVVRQLRGAMPAADYRVAATFFNRVRNGGTIESNSAGTSPPPGAGQGVPLPTFYQYAIADVRVAEGGDGFIQIRQFRFGARLPYQPTQAGGAINYQDTGLGTQTSVREGEPTLVGTLNTTRPGQIYALVLTVRRSK